MSHLPWAYSDPIDAEGWEHDEPSGPFCEHCGQDLDWEDCGECEDGYSYHDCGEDCCCCADPEPNVVCDVCDGDGGWHFCTNKECPGKTNIA